MTALRPADPAIAAYTAVIAHIETLIAARTPRLLRFGPSGLSRQERHQLAVLLAEAAKTVVKEEL